MVSSSGEINAADLEILRRAERQSRLGPNIKKFCARNPLGAAASLVLVIMIILALGASFFATHHPYEIDGLQTFAAPSSLHFFGTDELGRDVYSRIIFGTRISLRVGFIAVGISIVVGTIVGAVSAYAGGWVDYVLQRIVDALFAFPTIVLALAIVSVLGTGINQVITAVGIVNVPRVARVVRASTLSVLAMPYIEAAYCMGAAPVRVIARHILPNVFAPVIILATAGFGTAILAEASLSFLGVGTPPPEPSWGTMLSGAASQYIRNAPWMAIFPGVAISIAVFAFNLFGDALRDTLDPRLRGSN